ncbi:MAG TPA: efflux transporter outer membrane subunit [Polyangiaceae bacterium]|nr:efflux transporter outer membrane subunit [Polyangiaceae bacterium]
MNKAWPLLAACVAGSGCMVGPDFHRPAAPTDTKYTVAESPNGNERVPKFVEGADVGARWWRMLRCPALDSIVDRALAANPGLEAARATLRQNQDNLGAGYGVFFPQMDARAGVSRQHYNPAPGKLPSSTFNLFTLSGTVSYALDVWGGERRHVEALGAAVDAQKHALAGAYVSLTANVINTVIAEAAYRAEIDATRTTLALLSQQVRIANAQATAGTAPFANVLSLQSEVASTEATLPVLEQKVDQAADLLAALTGATPAAFAANLPSLWDLNTPDTLPLTLPSKLVRQRPDVLVAEAELHAANAEIGVATAAMLPNVTLSATYGVNNSSPGDLFASGSPFWSVAAGLTQPVFHGGTLYYQRRAAIEARNVAAAQYRETVLGAFEQVADTLRGLQHDGEALAAQIEAVETSERAARLVQANYQAGMGTYLQVLVADTQYLRAQLGYIEAAAQRLQDAVALYMALGGGWWNSPEATHG